MTIAYWTLSFSAAYLFLSLLVLFLVRPGIHVAWCGHETPARGTVFIGGWLRKMTLPFRHGRPVFCLACAEKNGIVCGICARPISFGDPVLLSPLHEKPTVIFPEAAIRYRQGGERSFVVKRFPTGEMAPETEEWIFRHGGEASLICCCQEGCAGHSFFDGYWAYPGKVMGVTVAWRRKLFRGSFFDHVSRMIPVVLDSYFAHAAMFGDVGTVTIVREAEE